MHRIEPYREAEATGNRKFNIVNFSCGVSIECIILFIFLRILNLFFPSLLNRGSVLVGIGKEQKLKKH